MPDPSTPGDEGVTITLAHRLSPEGHELISRLKLELAERYPDSEARKTGAERA